MRQEESTLVPLAREGRLRSWEAGKLGSWECRNRHRSERGMQRRMRPTSQDEVHGADGLKCCVGRRADG